MIYLDTSIVLAQLLSETRRPPNGFWDNTFISSRLMEYEVWTRIHRGNRTASHSDITRSLIGRVALVELSRIILGRIVDGFPTSIRTLDAIHLATILHLMESKEPISLATYDERLADGAKRFGISRAEGIG